MKTGTEEGSFPMERLHYELYSFCATRWSSTFKMADRVLMLNPVCTQVLTRSMSRFDDHAANSWSKAIQFFLLETQNTDVADLSMDVKDIDVLRVHQIIEVHHMA
jgi:hypothetical protein